jgi:hypothetical protein
MPAVRVKICIKCGKKKKETEFYRYYKNGSSKGHRNECKKCTLKYKKERSERIKPYREFGLVKTKLKDVFLGY